MGIEYILFICLAIFMIIGYISNNPIQLCKRKYSNSRSKSPLVIKEISKNGLLMKEQITQMTRQELIEYLINNIGKSKDQSLKLWTQEYFSRLSDADLLKSGIDISK